MLKTISLFGLVLALGASAVLFLGTPRTTQVMAREDGARSEQRCPLVDVAVDEGYGVAKRVMTGSVPKRASYNGNTQASQA